MKTFKYWDYSKGHWNKTLLFECQAAGILEADKLFENNFSIKLVKTPAINCQVI